MEALSESEYVTALAPDREQATTSSLTFVSALEELEEQIERSKTHWSELAEPDSNSTDEEAEAKIDNQKVFKTLQAHPTWGNFFRTFGYALENDRESSGELEIGEKFAEGGQAELYDVSVKWRNPQRNASDRQKSVEYVMKIFKKGAKVRHLQEQWPHGMLQRHADIEELTQRGKSPGPRYRCDIRCATLLEDGRFAFLMVREHEDLRTRINRKLLERSGHGNGPFRKENGEELMYDVAQGMYWLHWFNIVHRDLKASNVLFHYNENGWSCVVADYECSVGVIGTRFWRAPEILQACKDRNVTKRPELFTREADAYSYGMTCYEILTAKEPFEGDYVTMDLVIGGQRPKVPEFVDDWAHELLDWCWQSDPTRRPSFVEIMSLLEANSSSEYIKRKGIERMSRTHGKDIPTIKVHSRCN